MRPTLRRPALAFAVSLALALSLVYAGGAWGYHTHFVVNNCNTNSPQPSSTFTRDGSITVALIGRYEGYQWGGGCWNDNNVDDTPGAPDSNGEGPDCSGLVFKSWELESSWGAGGFHWWDKLQNIHGPYSSDSYHDAATSTSLPFYRVDKTSNPLYMDAFARIGHVGLLWTSVKNSDGTYTFAEAKGDAYGTNTWSENWMNDSSFVGVRRKSWTPDCYPNCVASPSEPVVAVES